jgi:uncharacterized membrane protein
VNVQEFAASLLVGKSNQIAFFLAPILILLLAPALYAVRKASNFGEMLSLFSMLSSLVLFWQFAEPSLGYYFVPVYALVFGSVSDLRTLVAGFAALLLSLFVLEGPFHVILPLGCLFLLVLRADQVKRGPGGIA